MGFLGLFETIFGKLKKFFEELDKDEPKIEKAAALTLGLAAPLLEEIVGLTSGAANATLVATAVAAIQKDMADVQTALTAAGPTPTVTSLLNAVLANLNTLLTDGGIKDSATLTKVSTIVKTITEEVEAILKEF